MGRKAGERKKEGSSDNFYKYNPQHNNGPRASPKFTFPQSRRGAASPTHEGSSPDFHQSLDSRSGCSYSIGNAKRFTALRKEVGPYKENAAMHSTVGFLPGYLKKKTP